jgi:hypothetical protein
MKWALPIVLAAASSACFAWEDNVERGGHSFSKYRTEASSGVHIGILAEDVKASGFVCRKGDWAHFNHDWSLRACFLAEPFLTANFQFPAGTWVMPKPDEIVVAFVQDEACQGFVCSGSGGPKGTQTSFYRNGRLKSFYPPHDTVVSGVPCAASALAAIGLHENGQLSECRAASAGTVQGTAHAAGELVRLDEFGRIF